MPAYDTPVAPLPGWPTEPEFVSARREAPQQPILPPGFVQGIGPDGQLVAVPVREQQPVPATFAPAPDVWPKRMIAACPLVAVTGGASWFLFHALAAAEGSLIALAVLGALIWAAKGSSGSGGKVHVENHIHNNVHVDRRRIRR